MKKITFLFLLLFISSFSIGQTLDQSNAPIGAGGGGFLVNGSGQNVGQSFTAGLTGDLSQINLLIGNAGGSFFSPGDFQLRIYSGNGYSGTLLNTTNLTISSLVSNTDYEELSVSLSSVVPVVSGQSYTIDFRGVTGSVLAFAPGPNTYPNGDFYFNNGNTALLNSYDLWFKTFVTTPLGSALNFDGPDDIVTFNSTLGNFGTGDFTIEFQIKTTYQNYYIFSKRSTCNNDNFLSINLGNGKIGVETSNIYVPGSGASFSGNAFLSDDVWHKVSLSRNAGVLTLYVDGIQDGQFIPTTPENTNVDLNNNYILQLGGIAPCTPYIGYQVLKGSIDEVRFWSRAVPQAEIINNMNCELATGQTGLLAYYKFNQGIDNADNTSITTLIDNSGNGNTGTLSNFTLTGATSNWDSSGAVTTGNECPVFLSSASFEDSNFKYYPNPTTGIINISYSKDISEVSVFNLLGQNILTKKGNDLDMQLDLSSLPSGTYLIKIASEGQSKTVKVIKQ